MRRIAVYFAGRIQGYEDCLEQLLQIKNDYSPIFFISLNIDSNEAELTYVEKFKQLFSIEDECVNLEKTILPGFLKEEDFTSSQEFIGWDNKTNSRIFLGEKFLNKKTKFWKFANSDLYKTYSQYYHNKQAFNLIVTYQKSHSVEFDVVLKFRADIKYSQPLHLYIPLKDRLYIPEGNDYEEGINAFIAYGDLESMRKYSHMVDNIESIINTNYMFHSEQMLKIYLDTACKVTIIRFPFITELTDKRYLSNLKLN
jgi:hypothetical protein